MIGCWNTECGKNKKIECTLFKAPALSNLKAIIESVKSIPTDNLHAGWGSSNTCRNDGIAVPSPTRLQRLYISVCMPYQFQYTLVAEDLKKEEPYLNEANDGAQFCRSLCHEENIDQCVAYQWVEETSK